MCALIVLVDGGVPDRVLLKSNHDDVVGRPERSGNRPGALARQITVQDRQCQQAPRWRTGAAAGRDLLRRLGDYTAGYADARAEDRPR